MGTPILREHYCGDEFTSQVNEIIDSYDTRRDSNDLNDRIVRDSDKLWRFEPTGIAVACDSFGVTPRGYADRLEPMISKLETDAAKDLTSKTFATNHQQSKLHAI